MKKFLSVALSLVMLFTVTTFNGNAVDGSQMGEPQKVTSAQTRRSRRNVNFKEQNQGSTFRKFTAKASKALKSTGRAIAGAAKVAGEFVIENAKPIAIVGLGAAGAASTTWVGVNAYKNRENIKAVYNNKEVSKKQKTADVLKLLFGIKAKEEPKNDNGNKEQPSNGSNENTANNEKSASQDNEKNGENKANKEEQPKQKGKLYCATHLDKCTDALNNSEKLIKEALDKAAKDKQEALDKAAKDKQEALDKAAKDKQEALDKAAKDKQEALDKAAKDKKEALDKAAKDKQEALDKAAKDKKEALDKAAEDKKEALKEANEKLNTCKNDLNNAKKNNEQ